MAIRLSNRVTVTAMPRATFFIGLDYSIVGVAMILLEPAQQGRTEVETEVRIVVDCPRLSVIESHRAVGSVTFGVNAFVPIVKRSCSWLCFNYPRPGIFAGRLIEVAVNDECRHFGVRRLDDAF